MTTNFEIDDSLYSRQRYVLGDGAMRRMAKSNVLLYGLGGLGIEIAKNVVLAGVKSITVQDPKKCSVQDLGNQFFIRKEDVSSEKFRVEASQKNLSELNPYVMVRTLSTKLDEAIDLSYLLEYQCIILTECSLDVQIRVNNFCRGQVPNIKFISGDVCGVFSSSFCDFGDDFEIVDQDGEQVQEFFIGNITKASPGEVTCLENNRHGLESGDYVTFKEVKGMDFLNGSNYPIEVTGPFTFAICDTTGDSFKEYTGDGIVKPIKMPKLMKFDSLEQQLHNPSLLIADLSKFSVPINSHIAFLAYHKFVKKLGRLPNVHCSNDADAMLKLAQEINNFSQQKAEPLNVDVITKFSHTCQGQLAPLCATVGGILAQEGLIALTGKFSPLNQWLYLDSIELLQGNSSCDIQSFLPKNDRYDPLRICIGDNLCKELANVKLFMVGCGAIGCEMLKNYALAGIGSSSEGKITITDNDIIEKSNLNRQFLFRPEHIQTPKSTTAAQAAREINSDLKIEAQQNKVCPQTEATNYPDAFFQQQDIMVNALDNVEARRYMDSRCVTNQKPLLESGTMGAKGHVQVIVPHVTESYGSQMDPPEKDVPYCTLKSFPSVIEHCIQWARDKFESCYNQKPSFFNKFWSKMTPQEVMDRLNRGDTLDGVIQVSKLVRNRATSWPDCVRYGRIKFEKYFNHKAMNLLHAFPLDTKLQDGSLFWQSPKRPPKPIVFDLNNDVHLQFVASSARLFADVNNVPWNSDDISPANVLKILENVEVPQFVPSSKTIVTDENAKAEDAPSYSDDDGITQSLDRIRTAEKKNSSDSFKQMSPLEFEKDLDENGHIDFITAATNLRASMYNIDEIDRLGAKRIAGRIVPAIATTTAAVAGLVTIELMKIIKKAPLEHLKNTFLNIALPVIVSSEPAAAERTYVREGLSFTLWDHWIVRGNTNFTLQNFISDVKSKYGVEPSAVLQGVRMIYVPIMPGHTKRLVHTMIKLLKPTPDKKYIDLIISVENEDGDEISAPPVRYYFGV